MRSGSEIYTLISKIAESDKRVRVVLLNGSRANPIAKKDKFKDFDIVFLMFRYWIFSERITQSHYKSL